ncbi:gcrA cell cycle regulator family protein [Grimontia hollisae]|uniref:gcrA cell cycle regulator family protein n=1 Tax=Grimontia hollisae TaxID=673 RepID=UPI0023D9C5CA|nr:gcrA cell cycle regulator family protein [Grimontia hollisae]MDF2185443.1 gcrA cell cycle regulator family protein [Grimontia hollisae]
MEDLKLSHDAPQQTVNSFSDLLTRIQSPHTEPNHTQSLCPRWSEDEHKELVERAERGESIRDISDAIGRSPTAISSRMRQFKISNKKSVTDRELAFLAENYPLFGAIECAKRLDMEPSKVRYIARKHGIKKKTNKDFNPPIPRQLMPYNMAKRVALLQRDCPFSANKVEDCVVIFYDKRGPAEPIMAIHLDTLLTTLDKHFGRRSGVSTNALLHGYKAG